MARGHEATLTTRPLCLGGSGFLGGELSYRYVVRVADEATQLTGFENLKNR